MKKYLIIINALLLNMAQAEEKKMVIVLKDRDNKIIENASVVIDGDMARFDSINHNYYIIREETSRSEIIITHPEYETLTYKSYYWKWMSHELYMLKKGDWYYYTGGIKKACYPHPDLFWVMTRSSYIDKQITPEEAKNKLSIILDSLGLIISLTHYDKPKDKFHKDKIKIYDYVFIVSQKDGSSFNQFNSKELEALRKNEFISYAGSVLSPGVSPSGAISCDNKVQVYYKKNVNQEMVKLLLEKEGFSNITTMPHSDENLNCNYTAEVSPSLGLLGINQIIEKLLCYDFILVVNPNLISFVR